MVLFAQRVEQQACEEARRAQRRERILERRIGKEAGELVELAGLSDGKLIGNAVQVELAEMR